MTCITTTDCPLFKRIACLFSSIFGATENLLPSSVGPFSLLNRREKSTAPTSMNLTFSDLVAFDADGNDLTESLSRIKRTTELANNLSALHKEIALEQINILSNLPLTPNQMDLPKEAETALLILGGIYFNS